MYGGSLDDGSPCSDHWVKYCLYRDVGYYMLGMCVSPMSVRISLATQSIATQPELFSQESWVTSQDSVQDVGAMTGDRCDSSIF